MSSQTGPVPTIPTRGGGAIPQLGFGVFKVPPEQTTGGSGARRPAGGVSPHRHRRRVPLARAAVKGTADAGQRPGSRRALHNDQVLERQPGLRGGAPGARQEPRSPRDRLRRPVPDPLAGAGPRPLRRDVEGVHRGTRRGSRADDRRVELPAAAPAPPDRGDRRDADRPARSSCTRSCSSTGCARNTRSSGSSPRPGARSPRGSR